jgi:hypothetical protein
MFIDLFHHSKDNRKVYEISFEFSYSKRHRVVSRGYVLAFGEEQALTRLKFELEHHHRKFLKLVEPIKPIELSTWDEYCHHNTPSYADNMPNAEELAKHHDAKVFMLPGIEIDGPLE